MKLSVRYLFVAAAAFTAGWIFPRAGSAESSPPDGSARIQPPKNPGARDTLAVRIQHDEPAARGAWDRALAQEDGAWRELETLRAWRCLAEKNPALAWSESFRLTEGAALRATLTPDSAEAAAWLAATPEEHRANAAVEAAALLLQRSPEEALQFAAALPDEEQREGAGLAVAVQWAKLDPAAAAEWGAAQPERAEALAAVVAGWAAADVMAASEWLAAQPAGAWSDAATLSLIEPLLEVEPASALAWSESLTDPEMRRITRERIAEAQ